MLAAVLLTGCGQIRNMRSAALQQPQEVATDQISPQLQNAEPDGEDQQNHLVGSRASQEVDSQAGDGQSGPDAIDSSQPNSRADQSETEGRIEDNQTFDPADSGGKPKASPQDDGAQGEGNQTATRVSDSSQTPTKSDEDESHRQAGTQPSGGGSAQDQTKPISFQQVQGEEEAVPGPAPSDVESNRFSYLVAGVNLDEFSEFVPAASDESPFQAYSNTRLFGTFNFVKKARRFNTAVNYKGGVAVNENTNSPLYGNTLQQVTAQENVTWKRTKLLMEDAVSDSPGASFGSAAFGGASAYTLGEGSTGTSDFFGFNDFGGFRAQHITEVALGQVTEPLTPRSGITFAGAFAMTHYYKANAINSQQSSGLIGYGHQFTARTQLGVSYGYQYWKFPGSSATTGQSAQLSYMRQLSPRVALTLAGGPQFVRSNTTLELVVLGTPVTATLHSRQTGFNAGGSLGYSLRDETLALYYEHLLTSGSGLFAGASSDITELSMSRTFLRSWGTSFSSGFVRLSSVTPGSSGILGNSYQYWFTGLGVQKSLGPHLRILGSYQFNDQSKTSGCTAQAYCGSALHTAILSISWRTLPIRLDRGSGGGHDSVDSVPINDQQP